MDVLPRPHAALAFALMATLDKGGLRSFIYDCCCSIVISRCRQRMSGAGVTIFAEVIDAGGIRRRTHHGRCRCTDGDRSVVRRAGDQTACPVTIVSVQTKSKRTERERMMR